MLPPITGRGYARPADLPSPVRAACAAGALAQAAEAEEPSLLSGDAQAPDGPDLEAQHFDYAPGYAHVPADVHELMMQSPPTGVALALNELAARAAQGLVDITHHAVRAVGDGLAAVGARIDGELESIGEALALQDELALIGGPNMHPAAGGAAVGAIAGGVAALSGLAATGLAAAGAVGVAASYVGGVVGAAAGAAVGVVQAEGTPGDAISAAGGAAVGGVAVGLLGAPLLSGGVGVYALGAVAIAGGAAAGAGSMVALSRQIDALAAEAGQ